MMQDSRKKQPDLPPDSQGGEHPLRAGQAISSGAADAASGGSSAPQEDLQYRDAVSSLIGLGEKSLRKSYYPELRRKIAELDVFRRMVDHASDAMLLLRTGPPLAVTHLNSAARRLLGPGPEEGGSIDLAAQLGPRVEAALLASSKGGRSKRLTLHVQQADGAELVLEASFSPMPSAEGDPGQVIMVARDVTAGFRAERSLRESEERFRVVFEQSMQHVVVLSPEGLILRANQSLLSEFAISFDDLRGQRLSDAPWLRNMPEMARNAESDVSSASAGVSVRRLYPVRLPSGQLFFDCSFKPVRDDAGRIIHVVVEARDITALLEAENESRMLRGLLTNVVDSMPSVLAAVDAAGRVIQWNREAERMTGTSAREAMGRPVEAMLPHVASLRSMVRYSMAEQRPMAESKVPRTLPGGRVVYEDVTVYPLSTGHDQGAVIRIDDVSDKVLMEQTMVQAEKMLSVGGLAAGMAHEINNPLGAVVQGLQNVFRRLDPAVDRNSTVAAALGCDLHAMDAYMRERKIYRILEGMREASMRAADIVRNMLTFSRKSDMSRSSCDLHAMMDSVISLAEADYDLKKHYDFKRIKLVRLYEPVPLIACNKTEVEQVLLNLLRNAAQSFYAVGTIAGSGTKRVLLCHEPVITVRIRKAERYVYVDVEDNGPGMPEDVTLRVFEPFFTTKAPGAGTGLGLSVSYFIITRNHKGTMTVTSTPGRGSCFTVGLPHNGSTPE